MKFQICWYDPIDGRKDIALPLFDTIEAAARCAGDATIRYGMDMHFDIVYASNHRVVANWRQAVPNLETF